MHRTMITGSMKYIQQFNKDLWMLSFGWFVSAMGFGISIPFFYNLGMVARPALRRFDLRRFQSSPSPGLDQHIFTGIGFRDRLSAVFNKIARPV